MRAPDTGYRVLDLFMRCRNAYLGITKSQRILLNNIDSPALDNKVNLHYWVSSRETGTGVTYNLGDDLSPIIVEKVLESRGLSLDDCVLETKHLYAVGSILSMGYQNATIWGSGFLENLSMIRKFFHHYPLRRLDIRAVRGPYSRDLLIQLGHECPECYGDPVLLMPLFYEAVPNREIDDFVIIPHFSKEKLYRSVYGDNVVISMITNDYKSVINRICSAKKVISSSLHGIILGEAYGVPTLFLRDRPSNKDFKYLDYYSSTNRKKFSYADSIEQALIMDPMNAPSNISDCQTQLLQSFPFDLWDD